MAETPMMKQYLEIKKKNPDAILFFRLGDFYEMFGDDAKTASKILQITLTSRGAGEKRAVKMPMCGIPYHAANAYILKLINSGRKVAICEQVGDPKASKGIVKREITRIISPGTVLEDSALDRKTNNYLVSVCIHKNDAGISFVDASTGEFSASQLKFDGDYDKLIDEIEKISPSEVLVPGPYAEDKETDKKFISRLRLGAKKMYINLYDAWNFQQDIAEEKLKEHFGVKTLDSFGLSGKNAAACSAGAALAYLYETQKSTLSHIKKLSVYSAGDAMYIDAVSLRNLEIVDSYAAGGSFTTLFSVIDNTCTPMGSRELKKRLKAPATSIGKINERLTLVECLIKDSEIRENLKQELSEVSDIERIAGKIGSQNANARDLNALKMSIQRLECLDSAIKKTNHDILKEKFFFTGGKLLEAANLISGAITDDPPVTIKEGGIIKPSYNAELKELKEISTGGKKWITSLQERERKRTGISSLKVGYTSVFGYYIEISKTNLKNAPDDYIRKQTLVNAERFITPELKEYEAKVLGAQDKIKSLEYELFTGLREKLSGYIDEIQAASLLAAGLDCAVSMALAAVDGNYVKPVMEESGRIVIQEGRHPVIERSLGYNEFIPNDTSLDTDEGMVMVITGPNMAGKSTYMRQVAVICIMAQAGSFVPAKSAVIGVVDKIFTRVGAADYLARGLSTFMVEMIETANILNNATERSLILLDEVGRGTSTFDGVSIAWAITEYIHNKIKARTLFATHYYELTEIGEILPGVRNYNIQVKEWGDKIVFLRKIVKGSTDRSYGIHVGRLAGLPKEVTERAGVILSGLEEANYTKNGNPKIGAPRETTLKSEEQMNLFSAADDRIRKELENTDIDRLNPVEALLKLKELKDKL